MCGDVGVIATASLDQSPQQLSLGDGEVERKLARELGPWMLGRGFPGVGTAHTKAESLWIPGSLHGSLCVMFLGQEMRIKLEGETGPRCGSSNR